MARDRIFLENIVFYGYHGVHAEENRLGQRFHVDIQAFCDLKAAAASDDVNNTVNYSSIYSIARNVMEGNPSNLIESLAEEIAMVALWEHPLFEEIVVTIRKPSAPVKGSVLDSVGIEIRRDRSDLPNGRNSKEQGAAQ